MKLPSIIRRQRPQQSPQGTTTTTRAPVASALVPVALLSATTTAAATSNPDEALPSRNHHDSIFDKDTGPFDEEPFLKTTLEQQQQQHASKEIQFNDETKEKDPPQQEQHRQRQAFRPPPDFTAEAAAAAARKHPMADLRPLRPKRNHGTTKASSLLRPVVVASSRAAETTTSAAEQDFSRPMEQKAIDSRNDDLNRINDNKNKDDPFDIIDRFVVPHYTVIRDAICEIKYGQKESHWVWYLLPTPPFIVDGMERGSPMNRKFALRSDAEVAAWLRLRYVTTKKAMTVPSFYSSGYGHENDMWETTGDHNDHHNDNNRMDMDAADRNDDSSDKIVVDLRQNYLDLLRVILQRLQENGKTLRWLFPWGDHAKARASFELFERVGTLLGDEELYRLCRSVMEWADRPPPSSRPRFTARNRQPLSL